MGRQTAQATPGEVVHGPQDGPRLTSISPATEQVLGHVPLTGRSGLEAILRGAEETARIWGTLSPDSRRVYLRRLRQAVVDEAEAIARLVASEQGKPLSEAYATEIIPVLALLKWLEAEGLEHLSPRRFGATTPMLGRKRLYERYDPLGVVALITPWNYPFAIPFVQLASALAAGNVVVLKPSPVTPLVGQKIGELCRRAGLPAGVVHVVHLRDEDAPLLVEHPSVAKVFFTGSVETGRRVMASAAKGPKPVVLELGGKDPAIVAADADLERTAAGIAWYAMANSGQTCAAVECVYVHRAIAELFVRRLVDEVGRLRVGDPLDPNTDVGPLTTEAQRQRVEAHVEEAVALGARVLVGGHRLDDRPGYFYAPTVLADVPPSARVVQEETFGPVIPVITVETLDEAVELANRSPLGLTASVWTTNPALGRELAVRLRAGAVHVNDHACHWAEPRAAWGGVRQSGFGRVLGPHGLREMVNVKIVSEDYRAGALEPWWYPYGPHVISLLANTARALYAPLRRRPWALLNLLLNRRARRRVHLLDYLRHPRAWW